MGSQVGAVFFHFWLDQPADAGHWLKQLVVANHTWEGEEKMQLDQPCATLRGGSFCAVLRKL